jgi:hypothetical protein
LPNYRYIASYPKFYPDIRDLNGKSLDAVAGMVVAWDSPPPVIEWAATDEPVTWVGQDMRPVVEPPEPEPVKPADEGFQAALEPEPAVEVPEVPEVPQVQPEPVPSPDQA